MHDRIVCCDAVDGMRSLPSEYIPLTLTSPPFDEIRNYGGHEWSHEKFRAIADEAWRVTMPGGLVVWVVQDAIVDGGESGTSDLHKAYFRSLGFRLYQSIYVVSLSPRPSSRRYCRQTSLALVFSKGRPRTVNVLRDRPNSTAGQVNRMGYRRRDGSFQRCPDGVVRPFGVRFDAWMIDPGWGKTTKDLYVFKGHPAPMPETLAEDLILSWSRPGDVVLDPMSGSGTTCKMALLNDRRYLGFEVHEPYHRLAERRMRDAHAEYRKRLDAWLLPLGGLDTDQPGNGADHILSPDPGRPEIEG
jgi:DNA modification methylase